MIVGTVGVAVAVALDTGPLATPKPDEPEADELLGPVPP